VCARGATRFEGDAPDALLRAALCLEGFWLFLALGGALVADGASVSERLGLGRGALSAWRVTLAVAGFLAVSHGVHLALVAVELRDTGSLARLDDAVRAASGPRLAFAVAVIGLLPGVAEELLFRGLVQRGLLRVAPALVAVTGAAALFAVAHADPVHSSGAFVLGLYLGAVAWRARSVRPAVACHAINNAAAVLAAAIGLPGLSLPPAALAAGLLALGGVALAVALAVPGRIASLPEGTPSGIKADDGIAD